MLGSFYTIMRDSHIYRNTNSPFFKMVLFDYFTLPTLDVRRVRYACQPWFNCRCPLGKPVARTTMLSHRRSVNRVRIEMGRGKYKWGPKVPASSERYIFERMEPVAMDLVDPLLSGHSGTVERRNTERTSQCILEVVGDDATNLQGTQAASVCSRSGVDGVFSSAFVSVDDQYNIEIVEGEDVNEATGPSLGEVRSPEIVQEYQEARSWIDEGEQVGSDEEENSGKFEVLRNNRRKPEVLQWLVRNYNWIRLGDKWRIPEAGMNEILHGIGAPLKTWKSVVDNVVHFAGFHEIVQEYEVCENHMAFVPKELNGIVPQTCSQCGSEPPSRSGKKRLTFFYLLLFPD